MAFSYLFRSSVKVGVVGGATYATFNQGLWGNSEQSKQGYDKIIKSFPTSLPYLDKIKIKLPLEDYKKHSLKDYWNSGVQFVFYGLSILPCKTAHYSGILWEKVNKTISDTIH